MGLEIEAEFHEYKYAQSGSLQLHQTTNVCGPICTCCASQMSTPIANCSSIMPAWIITTIWIHHEAITQSSWITHAPGGGGEYRAAASFGCAKTLNASFGGSTLGRETIFFNPNALTIGVAYHLGRPHRAHEQNRRPKIGLSCSSPSSPINP
jgi:hypothetical protein